MRCEMHGFKFLYDMKRENWFESLFFNFYFFFLRMQEIDRYEIR